MEDKKQIKSINGQDVIMHNREKVSVSGVIDIHSFDDELVLAETELGILTIKGEDLKMSKLTLDSNELIVEGKIFAIAYADVNSSKSSKGIMNKLFK